jgi:hypothetical protein
VREIPIFLSEYNQAGVPQFPDPDQVIADLLIGVMYNAGHEVSVYWDPAKQRVVIELEPSAAEDLAKNLDPMGGAR